LPPIISGHDNYSLWGPGSCTGDLLLSVGISRADLDQNFAEVSQAATIACAYCMPEEQNLPIYILRQPRRPLAEMWPDLRRYGM
jgi:hypothetical protein